RVSGRSGTPRQGTYAVFSKSPTAYSGSVSMRWMVRFARGPEGDNIGFHEIPTNGAGYPLQSNSQLGIPLSHGCVRQSTADAQTMWAFGQIGTTVVVVR
ncbi:MAG: L,D-transpeptidase, partial [Ilumatobacteraceae bacterium]